MRSEPYEIWGQVLFLASERTDEAFQPNIQADGPLNAALYLLSHSASFDSPQ